MDVPSFLQTLLSNISSQEPVLFRADPLGLTAFGLFWLAGAFAMLERIVLRNPNDELHHFIANLKRLEPAALFMFMIWALVWPTVWIARVAFRVFSGVGALFDREAGSVRHS